MMFGKSMRIVLVAVLALFAAMTLVGCDKAAEKASEAVVEGVTGADIDADENKVTIEGEDGESIEIQASESELPEGFPESMPVYDTDIVSSGKIAVGDQTTFTVVQSTDDSFDSVVAWFHDELAKEGWTEAGTTESEVDGMKFALFSISSDGAEGSVNIQQEADGSEVTIGISVYVSE